MSGASKKLMGTTTAAGGEFLAIEDVFSTYLYAGNNSIRTITNGIDLAGEGGLVWIKARNQAFSNSLWDSERGVRALRTNGTDAQTADYSAQSYGVYQLNSDGFNLGAGGVYGENGTGYNFTSWTFRKAPRFFDVVTYTGDGVRGRVINHNLGVAPGAIAIKITSGSDSWVVWHRSIPNNGYARLNTTSAATTSFTQFKFGDGTNTVVPDDVSFTIGDDGDINNSGATYVAYLFAHDPLGPSGDGSDGLIACGSYTGNGSATGPVIDLGWEPQWLLVKNASASANWILLDVMRGLPVSGSNQHTLLADSNAAELVNTSYQIQPLSDGFQPVSTNGLVNASGNTYIYIAIRRGPMRAPESGTEVFAIDDWSSTVAPTFISGFPVDMALYRPNVSGTNSFFANTRVLGKTKLNTNSTSAEVSESASVFDFMTGWHNPQGLGPFTNYYSWMFRRAPGFFDVVAYTGNGTAGRTVPHNLGVAPEFMIVKNRSASTNWPVYHAKLNVDGDNAPQTDFMNLNSNYEAFDNASIWNDTAPTETVFSVGTNTQVNGSGNTYIAYLFATLPGVSKVGSYTGNGSSQTIDCGFTSGARFILIKRTDSTGDWYVWDTARGIVTGNDPHLSLNTTAAEVTTDDSIDPDSSGFIVNQVAATNVNVSSANYIFYAIA